MHATSCTYCQGIGFWGAERPPQDGVRYKPNLIRVVYCGHCMQGKVLNRLNPFGFEKSVYTYKNGFITKERYHAARRLSGDLNSGISNPPNIGL